MAARATPPTPAAARGPSPRAAIPPIPVYYETRIVGHILDGRAFRYEAAWTTLRGAFPISLRMPLATRDHASDVFLPWIVNLLPEAAQLRAVGTRLGAAPEDSVAILGEIGRDTAGALSIGRPGSAEPGHLRTIGTGDALERIIDELPRKPFLAGEDGVSMSLAGVQTKLGVALDGDGRLAIPLDGAPSTHILKPDSTSLFGGVQNEALCLTLARRMGLGVPRVTTGKAGRRSYFLIERYDRLRQGDRWRRLHQEDFCQALGLPPAAKYEVNQTGFKGPTIADMLAVVRRHMAAPDILRLVDHVTLNVICCNTDAHAKNYSLMISARGASLAPIYDVMCAAAWDGVTRNLAQKIAGKNRGEHLKRRHWEAFARECGLNPTRLTARIGALCRLAAKEVPAAAAEVEAMPAGGHPLLARFVEAIEGRARALLAGLEESAAAPEPDEAARPETGPTAEMVAAEPGGVPTRAAEPVAEAVAAGPPADKAATMPRPPRKRATRRRSPAP